MHPLKIFLVYNWKWNNLATATAIWKLFYYYLINIYIGVNITKVLRWLAQHQTVSSAADASARSGTGVTLSCARCRVLCISSAGGDTIITSSRYLRHFLTTRSSFLHKYILRSAPRITDIVVATWLYILRVILCTYLSLLTSSWGAGVVNLKTDNIIWSDLTIVSVLSILSISYLLQWLSGAQLTRVVANAHSYTRTSACHWARSCRVAHMPSTRGNWDGRKIFLQ